MGSNSDKILSKTLLEIKPVSKEIKALARKRLDSLTKPPGSLGRLEDCAAQYAAARGSVDAKVVKPCILTFAGDHGVADEGVSAFPKEVTPQMVANFSRGGAAINVLAKHGGITLKVIDMGVAAECDFPGVISRKIARGTANFANGPAMSIEECTKALAAGIEEAEKSIADGCTLLGTGDMGIANTTPSTALYAQFLSLDPEEIAGRGTGIDDARLRHKVKVIRDALCVNKHLLKSPLETLAALGGFEIAGICGTILAGAANRVPVVVDGFISGAAALSAIRIKPEVADYCFFSHLSAEAGHAKAMKTIGVKPLLDLDLRLGEGTGAAIAMHLIQASMKIMHEMATFGEAGVSGKN
ncbi:MAG: nicotinate-nucleotide--dimethylbenzimidazole phosphoribosyltransferase [Lentisphaerae bacterium GWF2_52_8]|nr:MAG: nicotinate-nucleotide--dimethylbenzimidazole phosphoribosyltransferase [Lentisphaerae bacterium GWF2_52_8]